MFNRTLVLPISFGILGLIAGTWFGSWRTNRRCSEAITAVEYTSVQTHVRALDFLYVNDSSRAIDTLERRLNIEILALGLDPQHNRKFNTNEREALKLAAEHRAKHPFSFQQQWSSQLIQNALENAH